MGQEGGVSERTGWMDGWMGRPLDGQGGWPDGRMNGARRRGE